MIKINYSNKIKLFVKREIKTKSSKSSNPKSMKCNPFEIKLNKYIRWGDGTHKFNFKKHKDTKDKKGNKCNM